MSPFVYEIVSHMNWILMNGNNSNTVGQLEFINLPKAQLSINTHLSLWHVGIC